jgi:hypothetical protein
MSSATVGRSNVIKGKFTVYAKLDESSSSASPCL